MDICCTGAASIHQLLAKPDCQARLAEVLPPEAADEIAVDLFGLLTGLPDGTALVPWDGPLVRIIEHRAHAPGHAALLVEERCVLVAGDMLSDALTPILDWDAADPIDDYLAALYLLEDLADDADVVIPRHGSIGTATDLRSRITQDRAYVHALRDGRESDDPRIGSSAKPGWDWVVYEHEGRVQQAAARG